MNRNILKIKKLEDSTIPRLSTLHIFYTHKTLHLNRYRRKLQNSDITSKDESLCNAIDSALNILKEVDLVL